MRTIRNSAACSVHAAAIAVLLLAGAAYAQSKDDAAREMVRRAQQALKKSEEERAVLARTLEETQQKLAEASKIQQEADSRRSGLESALRAAQQKAAGESRRADAVAGELEEERRKLAEQSNRVQTLQGVVDTQRANLANLQSRLTESDKAAAERIQQAKVLVGRAARQEQRIAACESANAKLNAVGLACLTRFETHVLPSVEPFTQLERVKIENILEGYRNELGEAKLHTGAGR